MLLSTLIAGTGAAPTVAEAQVVEKPETGWTFYLDNDALISGSPDRDYTGGFAVTLSGSQATRYLPFLHSMRESSDQLSGFAHYTDSGQGFSLHSFEFGLMLFTPTDQTTSMPILDDHPYASILFAAQSQQSINPAEHIAYQSTLTLGILGLHIGSAIQTSIHRFIDVDKPRGWHNQISDGGELTAKYTTSLQKTLFMQHNPYRAQQEFKVNAEANVGFSTDINVGINWRIGRLNTPWWSFNPHQADYINLGSPVTAMAGQEKHRELFFWFGANVKYRFYNSILQGQFRDSKVTFGHDQLNHVIGEIWGGVTYEFADNFRGSLFYRARTAEIDTDKAHAPRWAGIILSRAY